MNKIIQNTDKRLKRKLLEELKLIRKLNKVQAQIQEIDDKKVRLKSAEL